MTEAILTSILLDSLVKIATALYIYFCSTRALNHESSNIILQSR